MGEEIHKKYHRAEECPSQSFWSWNLEKTTKERRNRCKRLCLQPSLESWILVIVVGVRASSHDNLALTCIEVGVGNACHSSVPNLKRADVFRARGMVVPRRRASKIVVRGRLSVVSSSFS